MRSDLALAALASAAVPGMKPVAVASLVQAEESDHQQAVVEDATGRRWLVRSPLTPVAGARLRRGDELVRQLSRHVPFKVPAPVGYAPVGQDGHAVVYPHVEGLPLDLTHLPAGPGLASALGRAIAAVHNIPRGVFEEQDVPVFDSAGCRQRLIAEVDRAAETGRVPTGLLARWEEAFDAAPLWQFATTPVHGALRGSTVLVAFGDENAASGRVVAVTDWEEAMVADPAVDLAELYTAASPAAWESVLDAYALARAQRPDAYLHARARLVAETRRLRGLARAVAEEDEHTTRRVVEALRRMDRLTEDDDSLVPVTARGADAVRPSSDRPAARTTPDPGAERGGTTAAPTPPVLDRPVDDDATAEVPPLPRPAGPDTVTEPAAADPQVTAPPPDPSAEEEVEEPAPTVPPEAAEPAEPATSDAPERPVVADGADAPAAQNLSPASDDPTVAAGDASPAEMTARETPGQDGPPQDDLAESQEERLQELYGMPAPQHEDR